LGQLPMPLRDSATFDWLNGDIRELRARYEQVCHVEGAGQFSWESIEHRGQPLKMLIHHPTRLQSRGCCIVYFHGGGWIVGSPSTHVDISWALCEQSGLRVVSVAYRLAPEYRAPAPVEDGIAALAHILAKSPSGDESNSVILCGDSAGAAIAMAVERHASPVIQKRILGVCCLYGGFGVMDSASLRQWGSRRVGLDVDCMRRFWTLANVPGKVSPYAIESLIGPSEVPVYLLVAGRDPLRDDSFALAENLKKFGRSQVIDVVESETHGFLHGVHHSETAQSALERIGSWVDGLVQLSLP
jgi:acetyl esterase